MNAIPSSRKTTVCRQPAFLFDLRYEIDCIRSHEKLAHTQRQGQHESINLLNQPISTAAKRLLIITWPFKANGIKFKSKTPKRLKKVARFGTKRKPLAIFFCPFGVEPLTSLESSEKNRPFDS